MFNISLLHPRARAYARTHARTLTQMLNHSPPFDGLLRHNRPDLNPDPRARSFAPQPRAWGSGCVPRRPVVRTTEAVHEGSEPWPRPAPAMSDILRLSDMRRTMMSRSLRQPCGRICGLACWRAALPQQHQRLSAWVRRIAYPPHTLPLRGRARAISALGGGRAAGRKRGGGGAPARSQSLTRPSSDVQATFDPNT
jgi:hypothetical protein